jgi:hypothetical protein
MLPKEVFAVRQVLVATFATADTVVLILGNSIPTPQSTLSNHIAMSYIRETLISFF